MLTHFVHKPESLKKTRDEFKAAAEEYLSDKVFSNEQSYLDEAVKIDTI